MLAVLHGTVELLFTVSTNDANDVQCTKKIKTKPEINRLSAFLKL